MIRLYTLKHRWKLSRPVLREQYSEKHEKVVDGKMCPC